jgi:hypothetical protein
MQRYLLLVVCILSASWLSAFDDDPDSNEQFSHSFMFTRPLNQHLNIEQALWYTIIHNKEGVLRTAWNATPCYQQSIGENKTKRYFLPHGKEELLVAGDDNPCFVLENRDVRAEWLQLPDNYRGVLTIDPRQQQGGISFEAYQDIGKWTGVNFFRDTWVSIAAPLYVVENNMQLGQKLVFNQGKTQPFSIIDAFDQPDMVYAKITGKRTNIEVAELNLKFGRTYLCHNNALVVYYSKVAFPTGQKQNAAYLFDPFVGNNGHCGFGTGVNFQFQLTRDTDRHILCMFVNLEGTFYIRDYEHRTFDLRGKPWSRYMRLVEKNYPPGYTIPAANVLTQKVLVRPYNTVDFSTGLRAKTENIDFELGFNIWGRGDERVECAKHFPEGKFGIAGVPTQNPYMDCLTSLPAQCQQPNTASLSTIKYQACNDMATIDGVYQPVFIPIRECDLNLNSGAAQSSLNYKFHSFLGWHSGKEKKVEGFIGAGFFYDIPQKNSCLKLWGAWMKFGSAF